MHYNAIWYLYSYFGWFFFEGIDMWQAHQGEIDFGDFCRWHRLGLVLGVYPWKPQYFFLGRTKKPRFQIKRLFNNNTHVDYKRYMSYYISSYENTYDIQPIIQAWFFQHIFIYHWLTPTTDWNPSAGPGCGISTEAQQRIFKPFEQDGFVDGLKGTAWQTQNCW